MLVRIKSLAGQSIIYGLGGILPKIIGFLLIPLYTQFLSPADYGILAFTASVGSVLSILYELGIAGAVTRFYYDFLEKPGEMRAYLATIWVFLTGFAFLFSLFLTWQGDAIFSLLFKETPFYPYGLYIVWLSFFATADVIPLMLFRVREQAKLYVIYSVSRFLVSTVAIVYFVASLQRGAVGSLQGQLLANLIFFIPFTLVTLRNAMPVIRRGYLNATLRFSLPLVPHQLSGWALSISDRILLERYVSLDQLGLYSLGYRLAMVLDLVLTSINMAWSPFFYRTASTEEDAPHTFARITTYFTILMLSLSLPIALLAKDLLLIMANPEFLDAYKVVPVVVLAFIAHGFYYMLVNQLFYAKKTRNLPIYTLIAATVNIVLNLLTLEQFGIMAAAWNTVIGYSILTFLVYFESTRVYPVPYEFRRILIALLAFGITFLVSNQVSLANPYLDIIARSLAMLAFPILLFLLPFFTPQEIKGIKSLPTRLRRRRSTHKIV